MRLLKKSIAILAMVFATGLMFSGCSNTVQFPISGKSLFKIENCESILLRIGSLEYKAEEQKDVDTILTLVTSLKLKKVNIADREGGIVVTVNTPDKKVEFSVSGKNILYNNQWYEATEDISDQLHQFFE